MRNEIVLDLETKRAPRSWANREEQKNLGISVVGLWSQKTGDYRIFREHQFDELKKILSEADRLVGFAIKYFDVPVLEAQLGIDLSEIPTLDIFDDCLKQLGHRVSLDSLAKATLGRGKLAHGLEAVEMYRKGEWQRLEEYCLGDVRLTKELYDYGNRYGHLFFESYVDRKTIAVPIRWGITSVEEVRQSCEQAVLARNAIEIDYVSRENNGGGHLKTRKIEIRTILGDELEAYDHLRGDIRRFRIGRILAARVLDEPVVPRPVIQPLFP